MGRARLTERNLSFMQAFPSPIREVQSLPGTDRLSFTCSCDAGSERFIRKRLRTRPWRAWSFFSKIVRKNRKFVRHQSETGLESGFGGLGKVYAFFTIFLLQTCPRCVSLLTEVNTTYFFAWKSKCISVYFQGIAMPKIRKTLYFKAFIRRIISKTGIKIWRMIILFYYLAG